MSEYTQVRYEVADRVLTLRLREPIDAAARIR